MKKIIAVNILALLFFFGQGHDCCAGKSGTCYTIHGASYQKLENALNNINALKTAGYESTYKKVSIPGKGVWYRVYIGRYAGRDEALAVAGRLKAGNLIDAFMLQPCLPQTPSNVPAGRGGINSAADPSASRASKGRGKSHEGRSNPPERNDASRAGRDIPAAKNDDKRGNVPVASLKTGAVAGKSEKLSAPASMAPPSRPDKISPPAPAPLPAPLPAPVPATDKNPPDGSLVAAMRLFDAGQYEQALDAFKALNRQKRDPESKEKILKRLADCSYFIGEKGGHRQFIAAVDYYKDLLARYPDPREGNALVYYRLGRSYECLKFYYEALGAFEKLTVKYPDAPHAQEAAFKVGMMLRETRKPGKAIERLADYLKKYPKGEFARIAAFSIADCYYQMHQKDPAENWYLYVQKKWPATGEAFFRDIPRDALRNFGNHSFQMRRFTEAAAIFSRYLSLYPGDENNGAILYTMASAYREAHQYGAAIKLLSYLIERYPGTREAQDAVFMMASAGVTNPGMKLPSFMAGMNNYQDPIAAYDAFLAKFSTGSLAEKLLFQKALALEACGRNKEAVSTYVLVLSRFRRGKYQDESRKNLARNAALVINKYYEAGDHVAIADLYFRVFAGGLVKNDNPDVRWKSGESLKHIGLYDEAAIVFAELAKSPRDLREESRIMLVLADLDRLRGKNDAAEEKLLGLLKRPTKDMDVLKNVKLLLADIYFRKKLYEKAIPLYAESLGSGGDGGGMAADYLNYAAALREKNMLAPAVANYQTAIKAYNRNRQHYSPDLVADAYLGLGDSLYRERKYQEGLPLYQQALAVAQEQNYKRWSLYHVGQGYAKLNNISQAESSFNQLKESGKEVFWEKVSNYWLDDNRWYEKNIRYFK